MTNIHLPHVRRRIAQSGGMSNVAAARRAYKAAQGRGLAPSTLAKYARTLRRVEAAEGISRTV